MECTESTDRLQKIETIPIDRGALPDGASERFDLSPREPLGQPRDQLKLHVGGRQRLQVVPRDLKACFEPRLRQTQLDIEASPDRGIE